MRNRKSDKTLETRQKIENIFPTSQGIYQYRSSGNPSYFFLLVLPKRGSRFFPSLSLFPSPIAFFASSTRNYYYALQPLLLHYALPYTIFNRHCTRTCTTTTTSSSNSSISSTPIPNVRVCNDVVVPWMDVRTQDRRCSSQLLTQKRRVQLTTKPE